MTAGDFEPRLVSVVIPVRNGAGLITEQLEALAVQSYADQWEVVVVDNASTDGTAEVVRRWADGRGRPEVRVVAAAERPGISYVRNRGAEEARGDVVLFCDADDRVTPEWLAHMVAAIREHDVVGGALRVSSINDPAVLSWRDPFPTDGLMKPLDFLPFAPGANFGARRAVYLALGGCDELFRGGSDDIDFSWRAQLASHSIGFAPGALIDYRYRSTLWGMARQQFVYSRTEALLYRRYRSAGLPPRSMRQVARTWKRIAVASPSVLGRERGRWVHDASAAAGRLWGSLRHRVWFP